MRRFNFLLQLGPYLRISPDSFAAGKGTALVVDIGQSMASVTPVVDGFVLRKGGPPQATLKCLS